MLQFFGNQCQEQVGRRDYFPRALVTGAEWVDTNEHPPTGPLFPDPTAPGFDWEAELPALLRHLLFHAVFFHSWTGSHQFHDGGDVHRTPLGMRDWSPSKTKKNLSFSDWGPLPLDVFLQLMFVELLSKLDWGLLFPDESTGLAFESDLGIEANLLDALRDAFLRHEEDFECRDFPLKYLTARVNI